MASACLPFLFRAVEIDGVPYWDGGYMGNPVIFPFFRATETEDVLVVQINPIERARDADLVAGDHEPGERDHVQFLAAGGVPRDRIRRPPDRSGRLPRGTGPGNTGASMCTASCSTAKARRSRPRAAQNDYDFFELLRDNGSARRGASSTSTSTISA